MGVLWDFDEWDKVVFKCVYTDMVVAKANRVSFLAYKEALVSNCIETGALLLGSNKSGDSASDTWHAKVVE